MAGIQLIEEILAMTGLPVEAVRKEVLRLVESKGLKVEDIGLEELRPILVEYLQDTLLEAKQTYSKEA